MLTTAGQYSLLAVLYRTIDFNRVTTILFSIRFGFIDFTCFLYEEGISIMMHASCWLNCTLMVIPSFYIWNGCLKRWEVELKSS